MATFNITEKRSKLVVHNAALALLSRLHHEKKSCSFADFTPEDLLLLNGVTVQVNSVTEVPEWNGTVRGRVVAVLIPAPFYSEKCQVLFLPDDAEDPEFLDMKTSFLDSVLVASS